MLSFTSLISYKHVRTIDTNIHASTSKTYSFTSMVTHTHKHMYTKSTPPAAR